MQPHIRDLILIQTRQFVKMLDALLSFHESRSLFVVSALRKRQVRRKEVRREEVSQ